MGQRHPRELLADVAELGGDGPQKLAADRRVVKQVANLDHGAHRAAAELHGSGLPAVDGNLVAIDRIDAAAAEAQATDGCDRRQRLAPKAHRADPEQIVGPGDFAGGVAGDGEPKVLGVNPLAVVGHADQLAAAVADLDVDAGGQGVDAVFQELFDDARRPLDHLAGGNLVDDECIQSVDSRHKRAGWNRSETKFGPGPADQRAIR